MTISLYASMPTLISEGVPFSVLPDNSMHSAGLIEIERFPARVYRSSTSLVQRRTGKWREDTEECHQRDDTDVLYKSLQVD